MKEKGKANRERGKSYSSQRDKELPLFRGQTDVAEELGTRPTSVTCSSELVSLHYAFQAPSNLLCSQ